MKSDSPLDYAVFQLSPKHSRCELFVSSKGNTEKLASGSIKPFVTHLKVAEEQVALAVQSIKLEVDKHKQAQTWFTKGTLERFVRFVSTPEVLELVNTFEAEMSQLESARRIYAQGMGSQQSGAFGGNGTSSTAAAADATKKELLRAIDVRLGAVRQDLTTACARASAAGFNPDTVSELQLFADRFGAHRLNEASTKFISFCERRSELISPWKPRVDDRVLRSSCDSDMSIDDPTENTTGSHLEDVSTHSTCQQPKSLASNILKQQHNNTTEEDKVDKVEKKDEESPTEQPTLASQQPLRRLSVQDRIKLFETKQETTGGSTSGGKPVVAKPGELRRLSSDVSSAPAAPSLLRRWSGASDMSIDLSAEKRDTESPLCTPSSSVSFSKGNSIVAEDKGRKAVHDSVDLSGSGRAGSTGVKDQAEEQTRVGVLGEEEEVGSKVRNNSKEQVGSQTQSRSSSGKTEQVGLSDQVVSLEKLKISSGSKERSGLLKDQSSLEKQSIGFSNKTEVVDGKNQVGGATSDGGIVNRVEDSRLKDQSMTLLHPRGFPRHSRSFSGQFEGSVGRKPDESSSGQLKGTEGDQLPSQPLWRSVSGNLDEMEKKDLTSSQKQQIIKGDSGTQKLKYQKPITASREQIKKSLGRRDESNNLLEKSKLDFIGDKVSVNPESFATPSTPVEQVQRVRQTKGNQELNDELNMKANELEKLFAEHKLRVPGDQSSSARRSKPVNTKKEDAASSQNIKPPVEETAPAQFCDTNTVVEPVGSFSNTVIFSTPPMNVAGNQDYGDTLRQNFSEAGFSLDSKGKLYERYMQKRDAKLREEWGSKREEKEAKMRAMEDSFERSRAELNANFSVSADRQDSISSAHRRAEKLRSFNFRSSMKREQPIESTPWTPTAPAPRSSAKVSNLSSGRRRIESDNPLAQSVPNFSDFRKENTKPSSGVSKVAVSKIPIRSQVRSYSRSKSSSEETIVVKEEKSRRSQSLRKTSANLVEFNTLSQMNSDRIELGPCDKIPKNVESKSFLRKGNGTGIGSRVGIPKMKGFMGSETVTNEEEFDELTFEAEESMDITKEDEEEEEHETMAIEDVDMDDGIPRLSQESDKSGNSGSDNVDSVMSLSQEDSALVEELPAAVPSTFHAVGSLQGSPGESPMSWNLQMHHPFSYPHESSDIDASVDSPIGSPASWNSHGLGQTDVDAARMRKKWGSAQKPLLATNSSQSQSRKDMTKGFKRLLKFGRKSRGTDNMADWISATTSEGDDDTEDGRDPANRSSDDLRKSRMGFSQGPDDSFNEIEFNERVQALSSIPAPPVNFRLRDEHISGSSMKAPRSFFSLSSFRSKGSDSKLR